MAKTLERKYLEDLTKAVKNYLDALDTAMRTMPDSAARGKTIALLDNVLEMHNDLALHFGLGIDLKTGKKSK